MPLELAESSMRFDCGDGTGTERDVVDGFTYSMTRVPSPSSYYWAALVEMENIRRANGYRMVIHNVPGDFAVPLAPYETLEYQVSVQPGSLVWQLSFANITNPGVANQSDVLVKIVDSHPDLPLFNNYIGCGGISGASATSRRTILLPKPALIGAPGVLDVELSNRTGSNVSCQLLIYTAEPSYNMEEVTSLMVANGIL
jgi:hypothetical protein